MELFNESTGGLLEHDGYNITPGTYVTYNSTFTVPSPADDSSASPTDHSMASMVELLFTAIAEEVVNATNGAAVFNNDTATSHFTSHHPPTEPIRNTYKPTVKTTTSQPHLAHGKPTHRMESTFTGWITATHNLNRINGNYNMYVLYAAFGIMIFCFLGVVCWLQIKKRWMLLRYEQLPATETKEEHLVFKPSHGGLLDEEYENTFVGVSIPILQDVTKV